MALFRRLMFLLGPVLAVAACTNPDMRIGNLPVHAQGALGANFPVEVARQQTSAAFAGALGPEALSPHEIERLDHLIRAYWSNARGPLSITVPRSAEGAERALDRAQQIAEHAMWRGLRETEVALMVETSLSEPDAQIVVSYPFYVAELPQCGDWSKENAYDWTNTPSSNFGCASQRNLGAMVADPADLTVAREYGLHDTMRSNLVVQRYRAGEVTGAERADVEQAQITAVGGQ